MNMYFYFKDESEEMPWLSRNFDVELPKQKKVEPIPGKFKNWKVLYFFQTF